MPVVSEICADVIYSQRTKKLVSSIVRDIFFQIMDSDPIGYCNVKKKNRFLHLSKSTNNFITFFIDCNVRNVKLQQFLGLK